MKVLSQEELNKHFSQYALDVLYNFEGHTPENSGTKEQVMSFNPPTTYYGVTKTSLDELKRMAKKHDVEVPKHLLSKSQPWELSQAEAREVAQYYAYNNYMDIIKKTKSTSFDELRPKTREAVLMEMHRIGPSRMFSSFEDPKNIGSTIKAIQTGDDNRVLRTLMQDAEGKYMGEMTKKDSGAKNRILATIRYAYDDYNLLELDNMKNKDFEYNTQRKTPNYVKNFSTCLDDITSYEDNVRKSCMVAGISQNTGIEMYSEALDRRFQKQEEEELALEQQYIKELDEEKGFFNKFYNSMKNMFTSKEQNVSLNNQTEENNAYREHNNDLQ